LLTRKKPGLELRTLTHAGHPEPVKLTSLLATFLQHVDDPGINATILKSFPHPKKLAKVCLRL
jgi:hypothetical protein